MSQATHGVRDPGHELSAGSQVSAYWMVERGARATTPTTVELVASHG
jgi:hypothetical protein